MTGDTTTRATNRAFLLPQLHTALMRDYATTAVRGGKNKTRGTAVAVCRGPLNAASNRDHNRKTPARSSTRFPTYTRLTCDAVAIPQAARSRTIRRIPSSFYVTAAASNKKHGYKITHFAASHI